MPRSVDDQPCTRIEQYGDAFVPVESECCDLCYDYVYGDCNDPYCECHATFDDEGPPPDPDDYE